MRHICCLQGPGQLLAHLDTQAYRRAVAPFADGIVTDGTCSAYKRLSTTVLVVRIMLVLLLLASTDQCAESPGCSARQITWQAPNMVAVRSS